MSDKQWWEESPEEFVAGFSEEVKVHHAPASQRFYVEKDGPSFCVRDREILITLGAMRGQPHIVQWFNSQQEAELAAKELNETRGHASDEPRCIRCGKQPAGGDPPMCASCHSQLAD